MKKFLNLLAFTGLFTMLTFLSCDEDKDIYDPYEQLSEDIKIIDQYLADNNITAQKSASGLRYVVHDIGLGDFPAYGSYVRVNYEGKLLDGTVFDSSFTNGDPIGFNVGYGRVIRGMEEGVGYISELGKITLYIPSPLAYRNNSAGDLIEPNSILIFYVELISVQ